MTSPATINFSFPSTISGEGYRIKIKSSAPVASSSGSVSFAAYYKIQDSPFTINNLVGTAAFCASGSYLLTIDNPDNLSVLDHAKSAIKSMQLLVHGEYNQAYELAKSTIAIVKF